MRYSQGRFCLSYQLDICSSVLGPSSVRVCLASSQLAAHGPEAEEPQSSGSQEKCRIE